MIETPHVNFPALSSLAQVYFSEDWPDFYDDDPMATVDAFMDGQPGLCDRLPVEIDTLLASGPTETDLAELFRQIELLYDPPGMDGVTYRAWLVAVAQRARDVHHG